MHTTGQMIETTLYRSLRPAVQSCQTRGAPNPGVSLSPNWGLEHIRAVV